MPPLTRSRAHMNASTSRRGTVTVASAPCGTRSVPLMSSGHGVFVANVRAVSRIEAQRGSKQIFVAGGSGATAAGAALLLDSAESSARTMAQEFRSSWFSYNIPGFERYLTALRSTPCRLLGIGSHEGRSTCWLLENVATHTDARTFASTLTFRTTSGRTSPRQVACNASRFIAALRKMLCGSCLETPLTLYTLMARIGWRMS